jgi:multidrug efflux system outer membrane protein
MINRPLVNVSRFAALGIFLLATAGCALWRKDTAPLAEIQADRIRLPGDLGGPEGGWPAGRWWTRYQDAQLDGLVDMALKGAPALSVARERVKTSEARIKGVEASTGAFVGMEGSVDREAVSRNGFLGPFYNDMPAAGFTGPYYSEGTIGLEGGYTFDPWGKDKARVQAALGLRHAQEAELAETTLILSTRITRTYFQYQAAKASLGELERTRNLLREIQEGFLARFRQGLETRSRVDLAQARLLEAEGQIQDVQQQAQQLREQLRCLAGAGPDDLKNLRAMPLPSVASCPLPALGCQLLARRPDLQALHWYVRASLDQVEVARAAFYPEFDIRAFFGFNSLHTNDLLTKESRQMNLMPGFSLPLFDCGRLNANLAQTRAQSDVTIATYNQAVVEAVRQVAQCGIERESLVQQARLQEAELGALQSVLAGVKARHERGLVDQLAQADAELPVQAERLKSIRLRQRQLLAEVNLIRALGGGYTADPRVTGNRP